MNLERERETAGRTGSTAPKKERSGLRQFLREVRAELRKVAWPSRKEVTSYTVVVLVAVSLLTALVFLLDFAFGELVFWIFG